MEVLPHLNIGLSYITYLNSKMVSKLHMKHIQSSNSTCPVSCPTCVMSDTDTYNYTELCDFFKLLAVSVCQCPYPCFILDSAMLQRLVLGVGQ